MENKDFKFFILLILLKWVFCKRRIDICFVRYNEKSLLWVGLFKSLL